MTFRQSGIVSPMPIGNGAYVVHKMLESRISGYRVISYNPYLEMVPPAFIFIRGCKKSAIIHITPDYAFFFWRKSVPMILTFHNYILDPWMRPYNSLLQNVHYASDLRLWTRLAVKKAHIITAVSIFTAGLLQNDLNIHHPIRVIYNGIDTTQFIPSHSKGTTRELRVFFSGNLTRRKGAHLLAAIANRLGKNVKIHYTQGLRTRTALAKSDRLKAMGPIPFNEMAECYQKMDIVLHPSVREGFGLSIAEGMACGLPVVASNCSSIPELIDHGKGGFLCPVGDVDAFAEKINLLANSPSLRKEMGQYNRAKVEKMFTMERMVREYKELFEEVLDTREGRRH